jgi:hypothetical protein
MSDLFCRNLFLADPLPRIRWFGAEAMVVKFGHVTFKSSHSPAAAAAAAAFPCLYKHLRRRPVRPCPGPGSVRAQPVYLTGRRAPNVPGPWRACTQPEADSESVSAGRCQLEPSSYSAVTVGRFGPSGTGPGYQLSEFSLIVRDDPMQGSSIICHSLPVSISPAGRGFAAGLPGRIRGCNPYNRHQAQPGDFPLRMLTMGRIPRSWPRLAVESSVTRTTPSVALMAPTVALMMHCGIHRSTTTGTPAVRPGPRELASSSPCGPPGSLAPLRWTPTRAALKARSRASTGTADTGTRSVTAEVAVRARQQAGSR